MQNYQEGLTNMATTEKELGKHEIGINLPSFVLCMAPTMKKEVLEKYNISNEFFMMLDGTFDHLIGDKSMQEVIQESSFRIDKDFQIVINRNPPKVYGDTNFNLSIGTNVFQMDEKDYFISITEVYSIQKGLCYILHSNLYLSISNSYILSMILNEVYPSQKMTVNVVSEEDSLGVLMSLWQTKPVNVPEITFNTRTTMIDLHETIIRKIPNGNLNSEPIYQCMTTLIDQLIQSSKCSTKCKPMLVKSYFDIYMNGTTPDCHNLKDEKCIFDEVQTKFTSKIPQCKGQFENREYSGKISQTNLVMTSFPNDTRERIDMLLMDSGTSRTLIQEYRIYDEVGLIGTVGGSLGLFLGFSFYDFISEILDHIWKKIAKQD